MRTHPYDEKQLAQIARSFSRAEEKKLHVSFGRYYLLDGTPVAFVESQRAQDGVGRHMVYVNEYGRPQCNCEADQYRRGCYVACIHICSVVLRMRRAHKRGTYPTYRAMRDGLSASAVPVDVRTGALLPDALLAV